ncbi:MAG: addiction module protein [Thermodesulfobacteriota bacterium]
MSINNDNVMEKALSLPADARLKLVDKLLVSLNCPVNKEVETLWAEEAEKRVSQIENGEAKLVSGNEIFSRIRKKYGK